MNLLSSIDADGMKALLKAGADLWASYGYTTAQEGRSLPGSGEVMQEVAAEGGFKIDVVTHVDVLVATATTSSPTSPATM